MYVGYVKGKDGYGCQLAIILTVDPFTSYLKRKLKVFRPCPDRKVIVNLARTHKLMPFHNYKYL
jgi:hypothetical protein